MTEKRQLLAKLSLRRDKAAVDRAMAIMHRLGLPE